MDGASRALADLVVTPGQRVTSTGWLEGGDAQDAGVLWFLRMHHLNEFVKLEGGSVEVRGPGVRNAPRGVPVIVRGTWDGHSIQDVNIREAQPNELRIVSVPGAQEHPGPLDLNEEDYAAAQQAIYTAAPVFNLGGSKDTARHYVVTVTPELVDVVARGRIRTEIYAAIVPD